MAKKKGKVRSNQEMKDLWKARSKAYRANEKMYGRAGRVIDGQKKAEATRAKYGASGKPAPVVVKSLDGEVLRVVDQARINRK